MSKLRVEGREGWSWSHFLVSFKAVLAPIHSMTGTPKEISDWLQLETFEPLTKSGRRYLRWIIQDGGLHSKPMSLKTKKGGDRVGYAMALPETRDGPRLVFVGLKQDEKDGKVEFMTGRINYKSLTDFQDAVKNSIHPSKTAVAHCDKRMWTSKLTDSDLKGVVDHVAWSKAFDPADGVRTDFQGLRSLPQSLKSNVSEDYSPLHSLLRDSLPLNSITVHPEGVTRHCETLTVYDCRGIRGRLRQLRFVGGAQQIWVNSKCIGVTYFVCENGPPLTFFWYKKSGEEGWIREVRRRNHQSNQYEYAVQKFRTIKVDEPIPQTFGGPNESLILSQLLNKDGMLLNEIEHENIPPWLQPPSSDNKAETESAADVSESTVGGDCRFGVTEFSEWVTRPARTLTKSRPLWSI